jgi:hypothetical protein
MTDSGERPARGILDTSTVIAMRDITDPSALPPEPLITTVTLAELSAGRSQPPVSQARHRALARIIWCGVRQDTRMRSGLATMMARARAREVATFSRCGS